MARNRFGEVLNRVAAFVGVVDEDDEPKLSNKNYQREEDDDRNSSRGYSSPRVRANDRSRTSGSASRSPRDRSYASGNSDSAGSRTSASRRNNSRRKDTYSEWNTAPREKNRYADNIYDSDTTDRNYSYDDNDNGYEDDFNDRGTSRTRGSSQRSARNSDSGSGEIVVLELNRLADCKSVIMSLLDEKTVFISVEGMPEDMIRRVEDTLSGAVFALKATFRRTSEVSYLLAPNSISVSGARRTTERNY